MDMFRNELETMSSPVGSSEYLPTGANLLRRALFRRRVRLDEQEIEKYEKEDTERQGKVT